MADEPLEPITSAEEEGGPVKTFLEHLEDLRWVLIKCVVSLILAMVGCLAGANYIVKILKWPLERSGVHTQLQFLGPIDGFSISMKVALYGGITLALPFLLYFIGDFVLPALKKHEKKYFMRAFIIGGVLFILGMCLCYFLILQITLQGLTAFNEWLGVPSEIWKADDYFSFVLLFMVGMGLSFEIPVVFLTLVRLGVIPHEWLVKGRSYFFVANLVICSFITPDAVSTIFMVIPVQVLMEICIFISKGWERQKRREEALREAEARRLDREEAAQRRALHPPAQLAENSPQETVDTHPD
ncbi:MAG TPA: twin-arginine translocase subunit TatC [Verrucomicrobiae bacterium]|nr:twin-arginine translocase subunit TatC [Verrucomicrobiae bacterium]